MFRRPGTGVDVGSAGVAGVLGRGNSSGSLPLLLQNNAVDGFVEDVEDTEQKLKDMFPLPKFEPKENCISWYQDAGGGYMLGLLVAMAGAFQDLPDTPHVDEVKAVQKFHHVTSTAIEDTPRKKDVDHFWWVEQKDKKMMEAFFSSKHDTTFNLLFKNAHAASATGEFDRMGVPCHEFETFGPDKLDVDGKPIVDTVPISHQKHAQPYCTPYSVLLGLHHSMVDLIKLKAGAQQQQPPPKTADKPPQQEELKDEVTPIEWHIAYKGNAIEAASNIPGCPADQLKKADSAWTFIFVGSKQVNMEDFAANVLKAFNKCGGTDAGTKTDMAKVWAIRAERNINKAWLTELEDQRVAQQEAQAKLLGQ